jgi:alkanesulfonate monooxygenase SsuD/methylene tetrahydromethanopterin reductase-like flavin-dependent oxidoreductase (luciferase family)
MAGSRDSVTVGIFPTTGPLDQTDDVRVHLGAVHDAGIDHVCVGDHVSFFVGAGLDGLLQATTLALLHPTLPVMTGVYLLPLRHPVLVARQLSDLSQFAPGRLVFGVGIGGEDRHEVEICGVDPATRGRRMEECLIILRQLLTGKPTTFHGEFFDLDDALIVPTPVKPMPIIVGGRSDAAVRRAGRLGDGWLGIWNSARRFAEVVDILADEAARVGRVDPPRRHAMQLWCGIGDTKEAARARLAPAMEGFYQIPFERFEKYSPYGTPEDIAEFLVPYVEAGCTSFNLIPQAVDRETSLAGAAAVKKLLARA